MTKEQYKAYKSAVANFFLREGVQNLSEIQVEGETGEPYVSRYPCLVCHTHLAGNRVDCNGYNPTTEEVQEYKGVCTDCVYYIVYGQLDDMTMAEIS